MLMDSLSRSNEKCILVIRTQQGTEQSVPEAFGANPHGRTLEQAHSNRMCVWKQVKVRKVVAHCTHTFEKPTVSRRVKTYHSSATRFDHGVNSRR